MPLTSAEAFVIETLSFNATLNLSTSATILTLGYGAKTARDAMLGSFAMEATKIAAGTAAWRDSRKAVWSAIGKEVENIAAKSAKKFQNQRRITYDICSSVV